MPVLVDTNVLVDVLTDDPKWADWSIEQLDVHSQAGLVINPVDIWLRNMPARALTSSPGMNPGDFWPVP